MGAAGDPLAEAITRRGDLARIGDADGLETLGAGQIGNLRPQLLRCSPRRQKSRSA